MWRGILRFESWPLIHREAVEVGSGTSYGGATRETRRRHNRAGGSLEHGGQGALVHQTQWGKWQNGAHLEQQMTRRMVVMARGSGAAPPDSGDGGGSTWGSFSHKKTMGSFAKMSSSSSLLQLWWAVVEDGVRRWRQGFSGFQALRAKIRTIGALFIWVFW
jgi:hypothetical protein